MAVIEVVTFRLTPGQDEARFLEADQAGPHRVLLPAARRSSGRTTAKGSASGEWLALTLWGIG